MDDGIFQRKQQKHFVNHFYTPVKKKKTENEYKQGCAKVAVSHFIFHCTT